MAARQKEKRGVRPANAFTLVELLVVIAIIAVLIGILLPVIGRARQSASRTACRSNLAQIAMATRMYANDNRDQYPDSYTLGGAFYRRAPGEVNPEDPTSVPESYGLIAVLGTRHYIPASSKVWVCPAASWRFQEFKNTYVHALGFPGTSINRARTKNEATFWVWDNYSNLPFFTGIRRGSTDINPTETNPDRWQYPHQYKLKSTRGAINVLFVDGHVGTAIYVPGPPPKTVIARGE